ncbi:MAG: fumarylacetoacetate hydrolase family protein [Candidatus Nanopelagicales bacterium]
MQRPRPSFWPIAAPWNARPREPLTDDRPRAQDLALQSPVTAPCRLVAQMVNYRSHARESGFDPAQVQPTFFRKASHSISGPTDRIRRPNHVRLLDYEIELGLVFGAPLPVGTTVTAESLPDYVAGLVIANDVSARDVQLQQGTVLREQELPDASPQWVRA